MRKHIAVGVDIGTHQVKVVVAESPSQSDKLLPTIIGTSVVESKGLRHGYVVNPREVTKSIMHAIHLAEKSSGVKIKRVYLSIGGVSLASITSIGSVAISRGDGEVSQVDIEKAISLAEKNIPPAHSVNRKIIHTIPLSYRIDGKPVMGRALGMKGNKLEARVLFITCLSQHFEDLIDTLSDAGIEILDVIASPIASSLISLNKNQKVAGCLLANIGSETVSIVVFENNLPISLEVFPIGSTDITNDIALGLKVAIEDAENIKRGGLDQNTPISKKRLDDIINARLSDIFDLIETHLKKIDRNGLLPAGIILTGGGSSLATIEDLARSSLKLPSKVVMLNHGAKDISKDGIWSIAYGLTVFGIGTEEGNTTGITTNGKNIVLKALGWFKRFLP